MTGAEMIAAVVYFGIGVAFAVAVECRTGHKIEDEGGPPMVGIIVVAWPVVLFLGLLVLIGLGVRRLASQR